jgi:hypothetical protein
MIAYSEQSAAENAEFGVRANVILSPMDTLAVDTRARAWGSTG